MWSSCSQRTTLLLHRRSIYWRSGSSRWVSQYVAQLFNINTFILEFLHFSVVGRSINGWTRALIGRVTLSFWWCSTLRREKKSSWLNWNSVNNTVWELRVTLTPIIKKLSASLNTVCLLCRCGARAGAGACRESFKESIDQTLWPSESWFYLHCRRRGERFLILVTVFPKTLARHDLRSH